MTHDQRIKATAKAIGDASESAGQRGDLRSKRLSPEVCEVLARAAVAAYLGDDVVVPKVGVAEDEILLSSLHRQLKSLSGHPKHFWIGQMLLNVLNQETGYVAPFPLAERVKR